MVSKITAIIESVPIWGDDNFDANVHENFLKLKELGPQLNKTVDEINKTFEDIDTYTKTATTKAGEAVQSASTANNAKQTATTQAEIATTKAGEASTSASQALNYRNQAETFANQASASASSVDANNIVHRTGDEGIAGVKTFSLSPIVPTPTANTQVANKLYVDTKQSKSEISYNGNASNYIPNTLSSGAIIEIGSNANGQYIAFADGTLICRNNSFNFTSNSDGQYFYFPLHFIDTGYSMEITYKASGRSAVVTFVYNPLTGSYAHIFSNIDGFLVVSYTAIGRWK